MPEADYYALLARAYQGGITRREAMWEIDLIEGWSMIHAAGILHGESFIWPQAELSEAGRSMLRVQKLRADFMAGKWRPTTDL